MTKSKEALRSLMRQRSQALLSESLARANSGLWLDTLFARPDFASAKVMLAFWALPDEVPTQMLLERVPPHQLVLLPRVVGQDLHLHPYHGTLALQKGAFGICEPTTPPWTEITDIDFALIPGVAFDQEGHRLGRGRGYYDRLLSHPHFAQIPTIGLAFRFQEHPSIPCESHDCRVSEVIWV